MAIFTGCPWKLPFNLLPSHKEYRVFYFKGIYVIKGLPDSAGLPFRQQNWTGMSSTASEGVAASRAEVMESAWRWPLLAYCLLLALLTILRPLPAVYELSRLLNTGLDRETLAILMALLQKGVNPEALAGVVKDLRKEAAEQRRAGGDGASASAATRESPREARQFTGKQPLASDELQVSQVCPPLRLPWAGVPPSRPARGSRGCVGRECVLTRCCSFRRSADPTIKDRRSSRVGGAHADSRRGHSELGISISLHTTR